MNSETRKAALALVGITGMLMTIEHWSYNRKPFAIPFIEKARELVEKAWIEVSDTDYGIEDQTYLRRMLESCDFTYIPKREIKKGELFVLDEKDLKYLFENGLQLECDFCDKPIGKQKTCQTRKVLTRCGYPGCGIRKGACPFKGK